MCAASSWLRRDFIPSTPVEAEVINCSVEICSPLSMLCALFSDTAISGDAGWRVPGVNCYGFWLLISFLYQQLSKDPNIVIAKMDATANDVPSPYEVRG